MHHEGPTVCVMEEVLADLPCRSISLLINVSMIIDRVVLVVTQGADTDYDRLQVEKKIHREE